MRGSNSAMDALSAGIDRNPFTAQRQKSNSWRGGMSAPTMNSPAIRSASSTMLVPLPKIL
jgi:hypothetical protein